jgi:hypothetical protein
MNQYNIKVMTLLDFLYFKNDVKKIDINFTSIT